LLRQVVKFEEKKVKWTIIWNGWSNFQVSFSPYFLLLCYEYLTLFFYWASPPQVAQSFVPGPVDKSISASWTMCSPEMLLFVIVSRNFSHCWSCLSIILHHYIQWMTFLRLHSVTEATNLWEKPCNKSKTFLD
jgi:hypothetical protein